jgi:hypothetical protein
MSEPNPSRPDTIKPINSMIGLFFHSKNKDGHIEWQGVVIGQPQPGWYLAQLFSWLDGQITNYHLVRIEDRDGTGEGIATKFYWRFNPAVR